MSLSAREQQALERIEAGLAGSDPKLAAMLDTFTRLTSEGDMPAGEQVRKIQRRRVRMRPRHRPASAHLRASPWLPTIILLIVAAAITVAACLGGGASIQTCARTWTFACVGPVAPHPPAQRTGIKRIGAG